ncbi:MAG: lipid II flippase MurJ [Candidatus Brachytrichaceae bacterium NZ_4S206]|jgi:peptidoglycan biosynthesis protein MviN/MurJ (putative lipid II flippase)
MPEYLAKFLAPATRFHPAHSKIARNMILVAVFVGIGKFFGASKEIVVAYYFGTSLVLDAYSLAFAWVTWIPTVWQGVVVFVALPLLTTLNAKGTQRFSRELIGMTLMLGAFLSLATFLIFPTFLQVFVPQALPTLVEQGMTALRCLAPVGLLTALSGSCFALLLSREKHANTLTESIPAISISVVLLVWFGIARDKKVELAPLILGSLIGFGLMVIVLGILAVRNGIPLLPEFRFTPDTWHTFWQGSLFVAVNQLLLSSFIPLDQLIAVRVGEGAVAVLNYTTRVLFLMLGFLAIATGRSLMPILSSISSHDWHAARRLALQWSGVIFALGIMITVVGWILAPFGVGLIFERGAFTAQDTVAVSLVLRYSLLQIPFYAMSIVLSYLVASRKQYAVMACVALIMVLIKLAGNALLVNSLGLLTVAATTATAYLVSCLLYGVWIFYGRSSVVR